MIDCVLTPNKIIILYIVFEIKSWQLYSNNGFTLKKYLFGAVTLSINPDLDKYSDSGHGISFDVGATFSYPNDDFNESVVIFGADMISSVNVDSQKKIS